VSASQYAEGVGEPLPMVEARADLIPNKCIWKCGAACFHEAPNERHGRDSFADIVQRRISRRSLIGRLAAAATVPFIAATPVGSSLLSGSLLSGALAEAAVPGTGLGFQPVALHTEDTVVVPEGYTMKVLLRWGDPLYPGIPRLTVDNISAHLQELTFGYNNDLNLFFPLPDLNTNLMVVNHEYSEGARMFRDYAPERVTQEQVDVELAAHGMTIVELARSGNDWSVTVPSPYNRRITGATPIELTGPLRGHDLVKTSYDPDGTTVLGMLNNCSGGRTPWGTVLTAEENFNQYFANNDLLPDDDPQKAANKRYGITAGQTERRWERIYSRFDVAAEPNEVNRFGYLVEIDPYDPTFVPKKRTALGRYKHEAATVGIALSGQAVVYSGDDERFDYLYKFVTKGTYNPEFRKANFELLDEGTLYVAKFYDDGTGEWIPLDPALRGEIFDWTLPEVCLNTRLAGDAVGATPMDRPEDVEINPRTTGSIWSARTTPPARRSRSTGPTPGRTTPPVTSSRSTRTAATMARGASTGRSSCSAATPPTPARTSPATTRAR
jgi:secreted PhoX family phosphatase